MMTKRADRSSKPQESEPRTGGRKHDEPERHIDLRTGRTRDPLRTPRASRTADDLHLGGIAPARSVDRRSRHRNRHDRDGQDGG